MFRVILGISGQAVEDTPGNIQMVFHPDPDPAAVGAAGWTELSIPLSEVGGAKAAGASILYVGVGDRDNRVAAGTGIVYIDAIGHGSAAPSNSSRPQRLPGSGGRPDGLVPLACHVC